MPCSVFPIRLANRACRALRSFARANAGAAAATLPTTSASNRVHGIRPSADSATSAST